MASTTFSDVIDKLVERTKDAKVNWQSTSSENAFVVHLASYSVTVDTFQDPDDGEFAVIVTLRNNKGQEIDQEFYWQRHVQYPELKELHAAARRKALKIDEAFNAILHELDEDI